MAFCGKCGSKIVAGNRFCTSCGAEINLQDIPSSEGPFEESISTDTETIEIPEIQKQDPEKPQSKLWMLLGILALLLACGSFFIQLPYLAVIMSLLALTLGILSLTQKAKLKVFPILAIAASGIILVLWSIEGIKGINVLKDRSMQTVRAGNMELSIPGYYERTEATSGASTFQSSYVVKTGPALSILYSNIYADSGSAAAILQENQSLLVENKEEIDRLLAEELDKTMQELLENSADSSIQYKYVDDVPISDLSARKYKLSGKISGKSCNGSALAAFDLMSGDFYLVLLIQPSNLLRNYSNDLDNIIASAKYQRVIKAQTTARGSSLPKVTQNTDEEEDSPTFPNSADSDDDVTPEFKAMMDAYEAFFDEYIDFIKSYSSSTDVLGMVSSYTSYMTKYAETLEALDKIDLDSLTPADYAYYMEVYGRIIQKLASLGY